MSCFEWRSRKRLSQSMVALLKTCTALRTFVLPFQTTSHCFVIEDSLLLSVLIWILPLVIRAWFLEILLFLELVQENHSFLTVCFDQFRILGTFAVIIDVFLYFWDSHSVVLHDEQLSPEWFYLLLQLRPVAVFLPLCGSDCIKWISLYFLCLQLFLMPDMSLLQGQSLL